MDKISRPTISFIFPWCIARIRDSSRLSNITPCRIWNGSEGRPMRGRNSFAICFSSINGCIFCRKMAFSIVVSCLLMRISSSRIEKISISGTGVEVIKQVHECSYGKRVRNARSLFLPAIITYESGATCLTIGGCRMPCLAMDFANDS